MARMYDALEGGLGITARPQMGQSTSLGTPPWATAHAARSNRRLGKHGPQTSFIARQLDTQRVFIEATQKRSN